ncbi:serine/threonine-protein kinase [Spirillospora sp. NPDC029432]|uniref:serine/threonine-protein kinase n=1 Tax=Spirillospora sp. NPDC029432 TaxID=3154599 RepID=UPI0034531101
MEALERDDPRTMGEYQLIGRLGAGGMGQVYLGRSRGGRMVAVKLVHAALAKDPLFRRRFRREVEAARRVGGEWTAPVLDADTESENPWVATGYVPGPTLAETVARHGPLPEATVLALASGLARALQAVHAAGLIHRDLKPSNVLVTIDGPKVIDFGIARSADASVATRTGALLGSPAYMSPEQARGAELSPASDIFSLGSVLAYAATGHQPFGVGFSNLHAVLLQVAQGQPQLRDLSGPVRGLVESCLTKAPDERPTLEAILNWLPLSSKAWLPGDVVTELGRHAAALLDLETPGFQAVPAPSASMPPGRPDAPGSMGGREGTGTRPTRRPRPASRGRLLPVAAAAAVAVIGAGSAYALTQNERREPPAGTVTKSPAVNGVVPAAMLGTWEGDYEKTDTSGNKVLHHRRISLTQGSLGADVAQIRVTDTSGQLCEYVGRLAAGTPTVDLRPRLSRSIPPGKCNDDPPLTLKPKGADLRWTARGMADDLTRARNNAIPAHWHGRWAGPATGEGHREFVIGAGAVGTEAIRSRVIGSNGAVICETAGVLVSAEDPIVYLSTRIITPSPMCGLGSLAGFKAQGTSLVWHAGTDDQGIHLKPM